MLSPAGPGRGAAGLLEKDFVTKENDEYFIYDHFFQLWLERRRYAYKVIAES